MFKSCVYKGMCTCLCVRVPPLYVGERAWDRVIAHSEAVVMATEDVVLLRKISAVPESYRPFSLLVCQFLLFARPALSSYPKHSLLLLPPSSSRIAPLFSPDILQFPLTLSLAPLPCIFQSPSSSYLTPPLLRGCNRYK